MASENTFLLDDREENALLVPGEVNEDIQSSSVSRTKVGIAALLGTIAIGALIAFNGRSDVMDMMTRNASSLKTANFASKLTTANGATITTTTTGAVHPNAVKTAKGKSALYATKSNLRKQSRNKELKPGEYLMSLAEVQGGENAEFNECTSEYSHNTQYTHVNVERGCISLFNNDISKYSMSSMITFCGCEMIGPKQYDFVSLQNAGLVSKAGAGLISYIATGKDTSITIYNTPDFTGDEGAHTVIGPETQSPANRIKRGTEQHWDNAIYSLVLQAWNSCEEEEEIVCSPVTTAPPVPSPTLSPFIQPTARPTGAPVIRPTAEPSEAPTTGPTQHPRARPTMEPLARPTLFPTMDPTKSPLAVPSRYPTNHPNPEPSHFPTDAPVNIDPTLMPTAAPSMDPRLVICKGKAASESKIIVGETYPHPGCASFFWSSLVNVGTSMVSTICSCGELGETEVPEILMADVGLVDPDGFPTISSIISGYNTSLTIYAPYWSNLGTPEEVQGVDKYVLGPREVADLTSVERKSGSGLWNDKVKSISIMAWNECTQHLFEDSCIDF